MPIYSGQNKIKLTVGSQKVKKAYLGNQLVYSAGSVVTYRVDTGTIYQEEVDEGASCLSPKTFTPSKSGWAFVGWRSDATANSNVYTSYVMGDTPVTLYAVFRQTVTVTYYNNSTTANRTSGYRYYNNGAVANPAFTLAQATRSGWTARGWSTSTAGNGGIAYANGASFTRDSNVTLYGCYQQTITVTYYNGSTTAASTSGPRYYNSGSGNIVNPTFTLNQTALSGWTARGWSTSGTANSGITYNNGVAFTRDSNVTLYGMYQQTITLTIYNGSATASSQTGTRYYCPGGSSTVNPTFTVTPASLSGWSFNGWATSSGATAAIAYSSISGTAFSANTTVYAAYYQTITLSTVANGTTSSTSGMRYFNTGNYQNPTFTVANPTKSGAAFLGWSFSASSTAIANGTISNLTLTASTTRYAVFKYADASVSASNIGTGGVMYLSLGVDTVLYNADATKYDSFLITAYVGEPRFSNPTIGQVYACIAVGNTTVRYWINRVSDSDNAEDQTGYPGYNRATFTITESGIPKAKWETNGYRIGDPYIRVSALTLIGKTVVG